MSSFDVAVVGGGIIGGAVALELARAGRRVVLLDRQQPGQEASWAAGGILSPSFEVPEALALVPLARASLALYPDFIAAVESATGKSTGFRTDPALHVFFVEGAERARDALVAAHHSAGLPSNAVSVAEARRLEPSLNPAVTAAALLPEEGRVDNRLLTAAVLEAARGAGVEFRAGRAVNSLLLESGHCTGVQAGGERFSAENVVMACGCFSAQIEAVARYAPTSPARGQMVALRSTKVKFDRVIASARGYVIPREDGRLIAGSTVEDAGFEKAVTPEGLHRILATAIEIAPELAGAAIVETWSGLRPDTPDHLPILGPTDVEGLWMATGHFRNGILLAPITARLMREWMERKSLSVPVGRFDPMRFALREKVLARP
jgi:glycine oxidase